MKSAEMIKAEAVRLGFVFAGITSPHLPPDPLNIYQRWLAEDCHAGMDYLSTDRARSCRADPSQLMDDVQSIIVVAVQAPPFVSHHHNSVPFSGQIAAYASGADYHEWIPPRLDQLALAVERWIGRPIHQRRYTDTGPLLERSLARQAGLGWIGKNACLIHPQFGSNLLLGELLVDESLEPDPPFLPDRCGTCQRCRDACPTACIRPDRTIDARRCLSYLTIENKGAIPRELRPAVGSRIFGCDVCQQVCPWNRHSPAASPDRGFSTMSIHPTPDLLTELLLTPQEFNRRYRGTPLTRAKRRGYLRNVAVALGNTRDSAALPVLQSVLFAEPEPLVRAHTAWAIGQISSPHAVDLLRRAASAETDPAVQSEITLALEGHSCPSS
ncbi:MAG: tRNA epoxyqueuosine(34) reductase QueG [Anaerolineaceae bacterium]